MPPRRGPPDLEGLDCLVLAAARMHEHDASGEIGTANTNDNRFLWAYHRKPVRLWIDKIRAPVHEAGPGWNGHAVAALRGTLNPRFASQHDDGRRLCGRSGRVDDSESGQG